MNLRRRILFLSKMATKKQKYSKMDPLDHILHRSDTYVGSTRPRKVDDYVSSAEDFKITKESIEYSPAILRIYVEPLSNAIDNVSRSSKTKTKCTTIKINVDKETGKTSIWNDGMSISIEMDKDQNCYNHTLIFGHLLTSSNYDDSEDRYDISGRNGLGVKLCLKKGTKLPDFSGNTVLIENVNIGDKLIGDDGDCRLVTNRTSGIGRLFQVNQKYNDSYVVNENHILSLKMPSHKVVFWNDMKSRWSMLFLNKKEQAINTKHMYVGSEKRCPECEAVCNNLSIHFGKVHQQKYFDTLDRVILNEEEKISVLKQMIAFSNTIDDDNTLDISIKDYMELPKSIKSKLHGYSGKCVNWEESNIEIDPYIVGLWLGNIYSEHDFSITCSNESDILNYIQNWATKGGESVSIAQINDVSIIDFKKSENVSNMNRFIRKNNLEENKHIPREYIINTENVRMSVLAGIIDSCGYIKEGKQYINILESSDNTLLNDVLFLIRSLGLKSNITQSNVNYFNNYKKFNTISVGGKNIKNIKNIPSLNQEKCKSTDLSNGILTVTEVEEGEYVGLEVDGNHRFVIQDFTVVHNCNVFSSYFSVKGLDPENKKTFSQEWSKNMKQVEEPVIEKTKLKKGYTEITWIPDFKQFGIEGYTDDIINLYRRYAVDTAMMTGVDVFFNDVLIPVKNIKDYSNLFISGENETESLYINNPTAQVLIAPSSSYQFISFVNGVYTSLGGTHVDAWTEAAFRPIVTKLSKGKGASTYSIGDVKKFFKIFVSVKVINPEFESQSKHKLESPVEATIKPKDINTILGWSVIDDIKRSKESVSIKKLERKKKNFVKIEGLDPANNEGGKHSSDCTLILVEGLSAKTYAVQGIEVGAFGKTGRDWFGIYALRGKVLNVRNAQTSVVSKNAVVSDIIKALGVKMDVDYTKDDVFSSLRYGKIMIITDADVDGIHIKGLLINLFHALFPSLLERKDSFITCMQTPIVRVFFNKGKDRLFYDEREYQEYVQKCGEENTKINKKYYKGLGSSSNQDILDTFGQKLITFVTDENATANMNKVFHTKHSDARKVWLENYDCKQVALAWDGDKQEINTLTMSDFLNTEMILFSINDCKRSIPNMMDGLKESHRKTLFACFTKNLKYSGKTLKVAQLAGYVAEKTSYHHGEQNLYDTITKMANCFPGSNNIPLLYRDGQFGSRLSGGKDAANARYIHTKLDCLTRLLFRQEDDILLERVVDDGDVVEPKFYVPILPTILINGCIVGIGTGWSCSIPCYNPIDLIECVKIWLENDGKVLLEQDNTVVSLLPELTPWYRGYTGLIEKSTENKYISWGNVITEKNTKVVNELPIGMWTDNFKEYLDTLLEEKTVKKVKNYSNPNIVRFVITEENDGISCTKENLKLYKYIYTSNMVLFTENGTLKKFNMINNIIDEFCKVRYEFYIKRKKYMLEQLERELKILRNKKRFLEEIMAGDLLLFEETKGKSRKSRKTLDICSDLEKRGYDKVINSSEDKDDEEEKESDKGYDYLLRLQFKSITEEKITSLSADIASKTKAKDSLVKTSEKKLWLNDLDEFEKEYARWLKDIEKENTKKSKK